MVLEKLTNYSIYFSFLMGCICFSQMQPKSTRLLVIYISVSLLFDFIIINYPDKDGRTVRTLYAILSPIELSIVIYIFKNNIVTIFPRKSWLIMIGIILSLSIYQLTITNINRNAGTLAFVTVGIFTLIIVLTYYWSLLQSTNEIIIQKQPLFWIATALLLFYSGNIISTGFYHQLYKYSKELAFSLYNFNYVLNILESILFSYAFYISTLNNPYNGSRN